MAFEQNKLAEYQTWAAGKSPSEIAAAAAKEGFTAAQINQVIAPLGHTTGVQGIISAANNLGYTFNDSGVIGQANTPANVPVNTPAPANTPANTPTNTQNYTLGNTSMSEAQLKNLYAESGGILNAANINDFINQHNVTPQQASQALQTAGWNVSPTDVQNYLNGPDARFNFGNRAFTRSELQDYYGNVAGNLNYDAIKGFADQYGATDYNQLAKAIQVAGWSDITPDQVKAGFEGLQAKPLDDQKQSLIQNFYQSKNGNITLADIERFITETGLNPSEIATGLNSLGWNIQASQIYDYLNRDNRTFKLGSTLYTKQELSDYYNRNGGKINYADLANLIEGYNVGRDELQTALTEAGYDPNTVAAALSYFDNYQQQNAARLQDATTGRGLLSTATSRGYTPTTLGTPASWTVTPPQTVEQRAADIVASGHPVVEAARRQAMNEANSRGLANSSIAITAGEQAALNAAIQIAAQDADTEARAAGYNADQLNTFALQNAGILNAAGEFEASAANAFTLQNMQAYNQQLAADIAAQNELLMDRFKALTEQDAREFNANVELNLNNLKQQNAALLQNSQIAAEAFINASKDITAINASDVMNQQSKDYSIWLVYNNLAEMLSTQQAIYNNADLSTILNPGEQPAAPDASHVNYRPQASGGGGGGTVVCTRLYHLGLMPSDIYADDVKYGFMLGRINRDALTGYYSWGKPLANAMHGNTLPSKWLIRCVAPFALWLAKGMSDELHGRPSCARLALNACVKINAFIGRKINARNQECRALL